jgi:hypothetical protein
VAVVRATVAGSDRYAKVVQSIHDGARWVGDVAAPIGLAMRTLPAIGRLLAGREHDVPELVRSSWFRPRTASHTLLDPSMYLHTAREVSPSVDRKPTGPVWRPGPRSYRAPARVRGNDLGFGRRYV